MYSQRNNLSLVLSQLAFGNDVILQMSTRQARFVTASWAVLSFPLYTFITRNVRILTHVHATKINVLSYLCLDFIAIAIYLLQAYTD